MKKKQRGQPSVFTDEQNAELRAAMRALKTKRHYTQTALGEMLGVNQQNASRLLNDDDSGFSYVSATRLCRVLGYRGVDSFFASKGVELVVPRSTGAAA